MTITKHITSRRSMIATGGAAALLLGAGPARAGAYAFRPADGRPRGLATADAETWRAEVGTVLTLRTPNGPATLRLKAVTLLPAAGTRPATLARREAFAASFERLSGTLADADCTYAASHPRHGAFPLHVSPRGDALVAVFN